MKAVYCLLLCLVVLAAVVEGHPTLWGRCDHPTSAHGSHKYNPNADRGISMKVLKGTKATATYCPGKYKLVVSFPSPREFLLTTSAGTLGGATKCAGAKIDSPRGVAKKDVSLTLAIPCTTGNVVVRVTSANCQSCQYRYNTITLKRAAKCPACSG